MKSSLNIAFLGNCTTDYLAQALQKKCKKYDIEATIYNCPYNQYQQDTLNTDSEFYQFRPELTILFLEGSELFPDWYTFPVLTSSKEKKYALIEAVFDSLTAIVENIHTHSDTKIMVHNFKIPYFSPLGILDNKNYPGLKDMISLLNLKLEEWACAKDYVYLFDYCGLCANFGYENAADPKMYYIAKNTVSFPFMKILAGEYMRYILPLKFMTKKCLVLDLDNTLWGGVAGEDGISGIKLDISGPGKSFYNFQKEILNLYHKGIILAINSKNNLEDGMNIIENHPHMALRKHHFSAWRINWHNKVDNLKELAQELNIGIDSMVFFDDNPVEREFVKSMLPEVKVVDVPEDTSKYTETLKKIIEFEFLKITAEDMQRNIMYEANQKRLASYQQFENLEDYLASLKMKVVLQHANEFSIPRIAQLTQKTNQFNMTTKRYTQTDIENMVSSNNFLVFSCTVLDKFGDNGIVGVCIVELKDLSAHIDSFLLSCRVLGRNVEYAFINKIISLLKEKGIKTVTGLYRKTEKNRANDNFYSQAGFSQESVKERETLYRINTNQNLNDFHYINTVLEKEE
ncbi:MAG: HAD-IIIC family phosphatase [Dehalobacterium sp.]